MQLNWVEARDAAEHPTEHTRAHTHMRVHAYRPRVYLGQISTVPRLRPSVLDCALASPGRTIKARLLDPTLEFLVQ